MGDLGKIITGKTPPTKNIENYGGEIPFITPVDMIGNRKVFKTERYISQQGKETVQNCLIPANTICVSCIGSDMGKAVITVKPSITNQQINSIVVNSENYYKFVYYLMLTLSNKIKSLGKNSTAVPILNKSKFSNIVVDIPNLIYQKKIADILSAYDDLIENNQKQIKLLEEAAQRLYKEWFVDLRFPGYESTPISGGIPQGWSCKTILECLETHIGGGWGKETATGNNCIAGRVIRGTDINDIKSGHFNSVPLRYHTENDIKTRALKTDDIVFELSNGNINNIGRSLLIDDLILESCGKNTICASFCKLFRPLDKFHSIILYLEIQDMQLSGRMLPYKKQGSNGINNFAFDDFLQHKILVPNKDFDITLLINIMNEISNMQSNFALLIEARDRLLPKLMSGEIEVK
ncbi:MAG: restriction endonuclease subunit S [Clostridia bacterium]|nr:restriction endonuclease subunit S [Clostridia bacterium]